MWGFTDSHHWRPGAGILDENYEMKPAGEVMVPILKGEVDPGDIDDEVVVPVEPDDDSVHNYEY